MATFILTQATAERSERYIFSFERTDLGVPLEVEFEETLSSGAVSDTIARHVSAPGAVYNVQIWSINGANFSTVPLPVSTTLKPETGTVKRLCTGTYYSTVYFAIQDTYVLLYVAPLLLLFTKTLVQYVRRKLHLSIILFYSAQFPPSLDCCLSPASSLMALSSTGYHQENPMEDQCMRLSMEQMTPTSLQWTLGVETHTTT